MACELAAHRPIASPSWWFSTRSGCGATTRRSRRTCCCRRRSWSRRCSRTSTREPVQANSSVCRPTRTNSPLSMADSMWAMGATGKFVWPIPDKGLKKRLHRITAPTLIVWGREDRLISAVYAQEFADRDRGVASRDRRGRRPRSPMGTARQGSPARPRVPERPRLIPAAGRDGSRHSRGGCQRRTDPAGMPRTTSSVTRSNAVTARIVAVGQPRESKRRGRRALQRHANDSRPGEDGSTIAGAGGADPVAARQQVQPLLGARCDVRADPRPLAELVDEHPEVAPDERHGRRLRDEGLPGQLLGAKRLPVRQG